MIKITLEVEEYSRKSLVKELDHVATLIEQGYPEGRGWRLSGDEEKEPKQDVPDEEEIEDESAFAA